MTKAQPLAVVAYFRMTEAEARRLIKLVRRIPGVSRSSLLRRAFQIGVGQLEKDPSAYINTEQEVKDAAEREDAEVKSGE